MEDTESGAHATTAARGVAVGETGAVDRCEVRAADNAPQPPVGAIADATMLMLEKRKLRFTGSVV